MTDGSIWLLSRFLTLVAPLICQVINHVTPQACSVQTAHPVSLPTVCVCVSIAAKKFSRAGVPLKRAPFSIDFETAGGLLLLLRNCIIVLIKLIPAHQRYQNVTLSNESLEEDERHIEGRVDKETRPEEVGSQAWRSGE